MNTNKKEFVVKFIDGRSNVTIFCTYFNMHDGFVVFYKLNYTGKFDRILAYNSNLVESVEEK